ncbi:hypothetical protein HD806DRAFT_56369 [Xylariaceae sp. AK1471]|nr:hypothetical protein HD806DRAFT_56369 [Xylariaceae sp. AK1471]
MSFSPTFGAVGDFISIGVLIASISRALNDTRGSKAEYQTVVQELYALKTGLAHVERLYQRLPQSPELLNLRVTGETSTQRCRDQIEAFLAEIGKYEAALSPQASKNRVTKAMAKIWWMCNRDSLRKLKEGLMGCCDTINMHLSTITMTMIQQHHQDVQENLDKLSRLTAIIESSSSDRLASIESRNTQIHQEVAALAKLQIARVERPLTEEFFTLHDAVGREAPVPLRLIDCWEAFQAVLTVRFQGRPGQKRVARGKYIVFDGVLGKDIPKGSDWASSFLPGRLIVMSIICQIQQTEDEEEEGTACPRCRAQADVAVGVERRCSCCKLHYRRLIESEVVDEQPGLGSQSKRNRGLCGPIQLRYPPKSCVTVSASYHETSQASEQHGNLGAHERGTESPSACSDAASRSSWSFYLDRSSCSSSISNACSLTRFSRVTLIQASVLNRHARAWVAWDRDEPSPEYSASRSYHR